MEIVAVRPSSNPALAKAENDVQIGRAVREVKVMLEQVEAEIVEIERRLEEDCYLRMPREHRFYLNARLAGFRTLSRRLSDAKAEVAGMFEAGDE